MRRDEHARMPVGMDIGAVRAKIAVDEGPQPWHAATPKAALRWDTRAAAVRALLREAAGVEPDAADIVVAVPDRWTAGTVDGPVLAPEDSIPGRRLRTLLTTEAGFPEVRMVPALQCVAAATDGTDGCQLLCDIGAATIDTGIYLRRGPATRVVDTESTAVGAAEPVSALLAARGGASPERVAALHRERIVRAHRARLVLGRAEQQRRYRATPVYFPESPADSITAEAVDRVLRPLSELAAAAVERLLSRFREPLLPDLIVTGGNALGVVVDAITAAADDRIRAVRVVEPATGAVGALRIARGQARVAPHHRAIGLVAHRIRYGRLESVVLPVPAGADEAIVVDIESEVAVQPVVRVRSEADGPWLDEVSQPTTAVPPGSYRVSVSTRAAGYGSLRFHEVGTGTVIEMAIHAAEHER